MVQDSTGRTRTGAPSPRCSAYPRLPGTAPSLRGACWRRP